MPNGSGHHFVVAPLPASGGRVALQARNADNTMIMNGTVDYLMGYTAESGDVDAGFESGFIVIEAKKAVTLEAGKAQALGYMGT